MSTQALLIEDRATIRDSLIPALKEIADIEVVAFAETAKEGIALFERYEATWQLAVIDLFLREGSGMEVIRAIKPVANGRPIVVLTNYATDAMRNACADAGAEIVFDKSTEIETFFDFCADRFL